MRDVPGSIPGAALFWRNTNLVPLPTKNLSKAAHQVRSKTACVVVSRHASRVKVSAMEFGKHLFFSSSRCSPCIRRITFRTNRNNDPDEHHVSSKKDQQQKSSRKANRRAAGRKATETQQKSNGETEEKQLAAAKHHSLYCLVFSC